MRKAKILVHDLFAGTLIETIEGNYEFQYDDSYLEDPKTLPVSLTLPKSKQYYAASNLFPFFDGLIPEGWLLDIGAKNWKLNIKDRMGLLLHLCKDCIGNVSVVAFDENK